MVPFMNRVRKALVPFGAAIVAAVYEAVQNGVEPKQLLIVAAGAVLGVIVHRVPNKGEDASA